MSPGEASLGASPALAGKEGRQAKKAALEGANGLSVSLNYEPSAQKPTFSGVAGGHRAGWVQFPDFT